MEACTVTMKANEFRWSGEGGSVSNREKSFSLTVTSPSPPSAPPSPPSPPPSPSTPAVPAAERLSTGIIVLIVLLGVGFLVGVAAVVFFVVLRPRAKRAVPEA